LPALVLCLPPVGLVAVGVALVLDGKTSALPGLLAVVSLVIGTYFVLFFPMRYGLDDTHRS